MEAMRITKAERDKLNQASAEDVGYSFLTALPATLAGNLGALYTQNPALLSVAPTVIGINTGGAALGLIAKDPSKKELKEWDKSSALSFIPGVGPYRAAQRDKLQMENKKHRTANLLGERIGSLLFPAAMSVAGALIANKLTENSDARRKIVGIGMGSTLGALLGSVPNMVGAALANANKRTKAQQIKHDDSKNLSNFLIPGKGYYNATQRLYAANK